jgi:hypothetical protein
MDINTELPLSKAYPDTIECQYVFRLIIHEKEKSIDKSQLLFIICQP